METLLYLAKVNVYWLLFYACYWLLLRKHTFFHWNRFYLLTTLLVAFALPVIHIAEPVTTIYVPETVYQKATISVAVVVGKAPETGINIWFWIAGIYAAVALVLTCKFFSDVFRLGSLAGRSERIDMEHYTLLILPENSGNRGGSSFSFFRWLFLSPHDYRQNPDSIIRHEYEHIRQWHTADVLLIEILKIGFWINPVIWLYKRSIETVHEYLADQPVSNRNDYASFLVAYAMRSPDIAIANHFFNSSLLKRRIQMIYKKRSSRWLLTKYLMILPVVACSVAISASRSPFQAIGQLKSEVKQTIRVRGLIADEIEGQVKDEPGIKNPANQVAEPIVVDRPKAKEGISPLPDMSEIDTSLNESPNLSTLKNFTDVAYGGAWSIIPRKPSMNDTMHQQTDKYRYLNYSDADLMIRKAPKKYHKPD